jgi:hypothetical protein
LTVFNFAFDLLGNSEALEQALEIDAARSLFDVGNRFCRQQHFLEGVRRAEIRLWRTLLDRYGDPRARECDL